MKRFRQYINEMPRLAPMNPREYKVDINLRTIKKMGNYKKLSSLPNDHDVYHSINTSWNGEEKNNFAVVNKNTKKATHLINTSKTEDGGHQVNMVSSSQNKPGFTASDVYHHLIKRGFNLHSDHDQSKGGSDIWKNLSNRPDIHVTHHENETGKEIPLDRNNWDNNYGKNSHFRATKKVVK